MWIKSKKEFRENPEYRVRLAITARCLIFTYEDIDDAINHNGRENFVDAWLSEPKPRFRVVKFITLSLQQLNSKFA